MLDVAGAEDNAIVITSPDTTHKPRGAKLFYFSTPPTFLKLSSSEFSNLRDINWYNGDY